MTNDQLLHKWVEQTITPEELEVFRARPEYASLTALYARTTELQGPALDQDGMLQEILATPKDAAQESTSGSAKEVQMDSQSKMERGRRYWLQLVAAACMLLVPSYFLFTANNSMEKHLLAGEVEGGLLPDQSVYALTGPAKMSYKKVIGGTREISLDGQAEFKVLKGAPFIVTTPTGRVAVLGTEFEVISKNGELAVSCTHGKVEVSSDSPHSYKEILTEGESMKLTKEGAAFSWKANNTKLKNVTLAQAQEELSKRYGLEFDSADVDISEKLSCNFAHDNLTLALKTTLAPLGLNYNQAGKTITLAQ